MRISAPPTAPRRARAAILAAAWILAVAWMSVSLAGCGSPSSPDVLLIVLDTLRPDHLGCYGYSRDTSPNLDRLASRGVVFENAYSNSPWTKASVATLLTGLHPTTHRSVALEDDLSPSIVTAFEIFGEAGYDTVFLNGGNPFIRRSNFDQGVDLYRFYSYTGYQEESFEPATPQLVADALEELAESLTRPFFAYLHLMDPHLPYGPHEHNHRWTEPSDGRFRVGTFNMRGVRGKELSDTEKRHIVDLYDGQIRYVDEQIGRLLTALEDAGRLRDTIVVVTSDHGEEFWEHGNFEHGHTLYEELLRVPLIVSAPGLESRRVGQPVQHLDLLPTLVELAGLEAQDTPWAGTSYAALLRGDPVDPRPLFAGSTIYGDEKFALVDGRYENRRYKIIHNTGQSKQWGLTGPRSETTFELYDLVADPDEQHDLAGSGDATDVVERMKEQLEKLASSVRD